MKADERIEKLLNRAGSTISDLRKPRAGSFAHAWMQMETAGETAKEWQGCDIDPDEHIGAMCDYICHLADVIDRMETALNNVLVKLEEKSNE